MKRHTKTDGLPECNRQAGSTLIETMIAVAIILICAAGVLGMAANAMKTTESQGHLVARTAEYSQDKMEQLLALAFCDSTSNTTVVPTTSTGGSGLAGCAANICNVGSSLTGTSGVGGGTTPGSPVANYVDYLDSTGAPVASTAGWEYIRVWSVTTPVNGSNNLKQIAVTTQVAGQAGPGQLPQSTVAVVKTCPF